MLGDDVARALTAPAGADSWLTIQDDLLRALAHSVSNRVGTILAFTGTLELGAPASAQTVTILRQEADRLEQLLQRLRLLPRREDSAIEPMLLPDALSQGWSLVTELPGAQEVTVQLEGATEAAPVRADPAAVIQACAAAFMAAMPPAGTDAMHVQLVTVGSGADQMMECRVLGATDVARRARHVAAISWLLASSRGVAIEDDGMCGFRLPTLAASRR